MTNSLLVTFQTNKYKIFCNSANMGRCVSRVLQFRRFSRKSCFHLEDEGSGLIRNVVMICLHVTCLRGHNLKSSKTVLIQRNLLHLSSWENCTLKKEAAYSTESSAHIYYTLWINIPYDNNSLYKAKIAAG